MIFGRGAAIKTVVTTRSKKAPDGKDTLSQQQNTRHLDQALSSLRRASRDFPSMESVLTQIIHDLEALRPRLGRASPRDDPNGAHAGNAQP